MTGEGVARAASIPRLHPPRQQDHSHEEGDGQRNATEIDVEEDPETIRQVPPIRLQIAVLELVRRPL
jgi:hypothetical protein